MPDHRKPYRLLNVFSFYLGGSGEPCRALGRGVIPSDLHFQGISLAAL